MRTQHSLDQGSLRAWWPFRSGASSVGASVSDSGRFNHSVGKTDRPIERAAVLIGVKPFTINVQLYVYIYLYQ